MSDQFEKGVLDEEESAVQEQESGHIVLTVGLELLWADFVFACFIFVGLDSGSYFWLWWVVLQGLLGTGLLIVGQHKRIHAGQTLTTLKQLFTKTEVSAQVQDLLPSAVESAASGNERWTWKGYSALALGSVFTVTVALVLVY